MNPMYRSASRSIGFSWAAPAGSTVPSGRTTFFAFSAAAAAMTDASRADFPCSRKACATLPAEQRQHATGAQRVPALIAGHAVMEVAHGNGLVRILREESLDLFAHVVPGRHERLGRMEFVSAARGGGAIARTADTNS